MNIQLHAVSQSTRNLLSLAANYSSTELLCTGSLIHFLFPVLVLRLSRCHQIRDHLPPNGNFLTHLVRRPTSPFHFPALAKHVQVLCGLSLGHHPVTFPRASFWRKCLSKNFTSHNRSKVRTMSHSHRLPQSLSIRFIGVFPHSSWSVCGRHCISMVWETFSRIIHLFCRGAT